MSYAKPVIFGCEGKSLTTRERDFFRQSKPFGFILFARNIDNPSQLKELCDSMRDVIDSPHAPILIDQEGGRVCRLLPPHWRKPPPLAIFGNLFEKNQAVALRATYLNHVLIADDLQAVGINVNCAPMLDTRVDGAHDIVGDRAFSSNPEVVSSLGYAAINGLRDGGVQPIIKHIPTHGPANCDSHEKLPVVDWSLEQLQSHFKPFRDNAENTWAMTAHIVYESLDKNNPATHSKVVIDEIIRKQIGFDGILISDDIGMKALSGSMSEKATQSIAAGCDLVLHCSGNFSEMEEVAGAIGVAHSALYDKYVAIRSATSKVEYNRAEIETELGEILKERTAA